MNSRIVLPLIMIGTILVLSTACQTTPSKAIQPNQPGPAVQSLAGSYTSAVPGQSDEKFAEVRITQTGNQYTLDFGFGYLDGHGAAPDATGTGSLNANGELSFRFEDSFSNRGHGVIHADQDGHWLSIEIDQVEEPRCLPFYGKSRMIRQDRNSPKKTPKGSMQHPNPIL